MVRGIYQTSVISSFYFAVKLFSLPSICRKQGSRILDILVSYLILILHIVLVADGTCN